MWATWQFVNPKYLRAYDGTNKCKGARCRKAWVKDVLMTFRGNPTVWSVMRTHDLCYYYVDLDISKIPKVTVPAPKPILQTSLTRGLRRPRLRARSAAVDDKVHITTPPAHAYDIPDDDRTNLIGLRSPAPLDEAWVKLNGMNLTTTRQVEAYFQNVTKTLNKTPGYVSLSALWNRPDMVNALYVPGMKFHADFPGTRVVTTSDESDGYQAYANMKARVKLSVDFKVQADIAKIGPKLVSIMGPPIHSALHCASNPYAARHDGNVGFILGDLAELALNAPSLKDIRKSIGPAQIQKMDTKAKACLLKKEIKHGPREI